MGRVRRQKRYKACDPFSKQKKTEEKKKELHKTLTSKIRFDLPPKRKDTADEHFMETKSVQLFQRKVEKTKAKQNKKNTLKQTMDKVKPSKQSQKTKDTSSSTDTLSMEKQPNESRKNYFARLDQNVQKAINTVMKETKTIRKKRKVHLQNRDEKKKKRKTTDQTNPVQLKDFKSLKDNVKFGEVVDAPPVISALPRNANKEKKYSGLKLMSMMDTDSCTDNTKKKRKDMNDSEKETFDHDRQKAIDAYRLIKKRKDAIREYKCSLSKS